MLKKVKVAVCGELKSACEEMKKEGVEVIDIYNDALDLALKIRQGKKYHLILVYAPQGEGLINMSYTFKEYHDDKWLTIPVRTLNEPACNSALIELKRKLYHIAKEVEMTESAV